MPRKYEKYADVTKGLLGGISEHTTTVRAVQKERRGRAEKRGRKRRWRWVIDFLDVTQRRTHVRVSTTTFMHAYPIHETARVNGSPR